MRVTLSCAENLDAGNAIGTGGRLVAQREGADLD